MTKREQFTIIKIRLIMVQEGEKVKEKKSRFKTIAELCKFHRITPKTFYKWFGRWIELGRDKKSLLDRKSTPHKTKRLIKWLERVIISLRDRLNWSSLRIHLELKRCGIVNPDTGKPISESCIRCVFERYSRGYKYDKKLKRKSLPPVIRYEKSLPGELGHIDTKKLKNVKGEDPKKKKYQFALTDDCTRIPYVEILPNKKAKTASSFVKRAVKWFRENFGIVFKKVLSDNGKEFTYHTENGRKYHSFEVMMRKIGIKHSYTRVYRPQTNGKVERFFKTLDMELYDRIIFLSHKHRSFELKRYLKWFIYHRLHMGIKGLTPYEKFLKVKNESKRGGDAIKKVA